MDSASSRALVTKEEKKQEPIFNQDKLSVFDRLPTALQRYSLSFLIGNHIEQCKGKSSFSVGTSPDKSFFFEYKASRLASAATKALHNLAHRINVNETLAFMLENPNILQTLPFPVKIKDRGDRLITVPSIMGGLVALDEFDVIEVEADDKPCTLIPTVFSWFNDEKNPKSRHIKKQLQQQFIETADPIHEQATKARRDRYLQEIETFIKQVINCKDILNGFYKISFKNLMNLKLVQNFIKTAFKPDPSDHGEFGIVWDGWQLYLDFIQLLENYADNKNVTDQSRPNLGGLWSRKADVVETAFWLTFLRVCHYGHLEVASVGVGNISVKQLPLRFDCSKHAPDLDGMGETHFFGFFGDKYSTRANELCSTGRRPWGEGRAYFKFFVQQKHRHYTTYAGRATHQEEQLSDLVEIRSSLRKR